MTTIVRIRGIDKPKTKNAPYLVHVSSDTGKMTLRTWNEELVSRLKIDAQFSVEYTTKQKNGMTDFFLNEARPVMAPTEMRRDPLDPSELIRVCDDKPKGAELGSP